MRKLLPDLGLILLLYLATVITVGTVGLRHFDGRAFWHSLPLINLVAGPLLLLISNLLKKHAIRIWIAKLGILLTLWSIFMLGAQKFNLDSNLAIGIVLLGAGMFPLVLFYLWDRVEARIIKD